MDQEGWGIMAVPTVSVLVPAYNVEAYVSQTLDSLAAQTLADFEVICINDGSTDATPEILHRYAGLDGRFRVIDKENSGYGASMNKGLAEARGTYVAILESDDFFEPNALELLVDAAEKGVAPVAKADFWLYWSTPSERRVPFGFIDPAWDGLVIDPREHLEIFYRKPSIWSAVYNRSFLLDKDIWFLETPGASYQDAGFNFKVWANARRVACVARPVLAYRQDNEQSSVNSSAKAFCVCDEYREMARYIGRFPADRRAFLQTVLERMKLDSYLWNYDRLSSQLKAGFLERMHDEFSDDLKQGLVDFSLFEEHARADFLAIVRNPARFERARSRYLRDGALNARAYYLALGGPGLALRLALEKIKRGN